MATLDNIKPANYNITYYMNDVFDLSITVTDEDGDAVDFSGKTLVFQAKKNKADATTDAVINISSASEITVSGAENNILTFSGTYDLDERSYYYDLENTTDSKTIMYGLFIVTEDVGE